jgi:glycine/D-amino acid oxidase-like deaminating enzyme
MTAPASTPPVWEDGHPLGLPILEGTVEADVCVVGLGGSGLSAALELRARGRRVVAVDAGQVAEGAAGRNGGFLLGGLARFYHETVASLGRERALALYRATLAGIDRIAAEAPGEVRRTGSLRIASDAEELADCEAQLEAMQADGLPVEPWDGPEGHGLLFPADAAFQPLARCRALARTALAEGARFFERSPAIGITPGRVATPSGEVRCDAVLVAVDGGLERVLPVLAGRVRTARLQMLATAPLDGRAFARPVYYRWGFEYWQQLPDGRLALGGFRDLGGGEEWTQVAEPSAGVQALLDRFLRGHLRVSAPVTHRWAALVGFTSDGIPFAGEVEPGVWAVGGYGGTGNVVGALAGRAVAAAVTGERPQLLELLAGSATLPA